jgi:vacuolar iron transporter family protein
LTAVAVTPAGLRVLACVVVTVLALLLLGDPGARLSGAPRRRAILRAVAWGAAMMAFTSAIRALVGTTV